MPKVKFLQDTVHPDYHDIKKGEVLRVPEAYADDYEELGIAEVVDEDTEVSRSEPKDASQKELDEQTRNRRRARRG